MRKLNVMEKLDFKFLQRTSLLRRIKSLVLVSIVVGVLSLSGCVNPPSRAPPFDWFHGNFTYSGEPKLGQEFEVTFYIEPDSGLYSINDSEITINIPEGLELIGGTTSFKGDIKWKERKELKLKLKAIKEGAHQIKVLVRGNTTSAYKTNNTIEPGYYSDMTERSYNLYIISSKNSGEFSRKVPKELWPPVGTQLQKSVEGE